jgi:hypothetical protein
MLPCNICVREKCPKCSFSNSNIDCFFVVFFASLHMLVEKYYLLLKDNEKHLYICNDILLTSCHTLTLLNIGYYDKLNIWVNNKWGWFNSNKLNNSRTIVLLEGRTEKRIAHTLACFLKHKLLCCCTIVARLNCVSLFLIFLLFRLYNKLHSFCL